MFFFKKSNSTSGKIGSENPGENKKKGIVFKLPVGILLLVFLGASVAAASASNAESSGLNPSATAIKKLLYSNNYRHGQISFLLKPIGADKALAAINQDTLMNPASVGKLITAAVALDTLGISFTFKTKIFTVGEFNRATGLLSGDLYILGGGDPSFTVERLWLLVRPRRTRLNALERP